MFLKAVRYHRVPAGRLLFASLIKVQLARALYIDLLEGSSRRCKLWDVVGDGGLPCCTAGCQQLPKVPAMASEGPMGRGTFSSLSAPKLEVVGAQQALWDRASRGKSASPLQWVRKHWAKDEPTCWPHGPWLSPSPLTGLQGYLPWPTPAPGVPLTPGRLCSISSQPPPSASSGPEIKEYFH